MNRAKLTLVLAAILAAITMTAFAPAFASTRPKVLDIGHCTASGTDAECITGGGDIRRPAHIWLNVKANPDQKVDVDWSVACDKGTSTNSRDGSFTAATPIRSRLLPLPARRETECWVSAVVSLHTSGASGTITAWLTARKR